MYKIEKNIPRIVPHIGFRKSRHDKFPWHNTFAGALGRTLELEEELSNV